MSYNFSKIFLCGTYDLTLVVTHLTTGPIAAPNKYLLRMEKFLVQERVRTCKLMRFLFSAVKYPRNRHNFVQTIPYAACMSRSLCMNTFTHVTTLELSC